MNNNFSSLWRGVMYCLLSATAWGGMFPVAGEMLKRIDPFYFTLIRYGSASLLFVALLAIREGRAAFKLEGKGRTVWLLGSMAFAGYNFLVFWGQRIAGPGGAVITSVMMAFMPLMNAAVFWLWRKRSPSPFTMVCILTGLTGVLMVVTKGDVHTFLNFSGNVPAFLLILSGTVGWVVYTIGGTAFPGWSALRFTTLSCLLGTGTSLAVVAAGTLAGFFDAPKVNDVAANFWPFAYMIVIAGVIAVLSWNEGIKHLSPMNALLFTNLVPVVSVTISVLQGYPIRPMEVGGAALTICALLLNNLYLRRSGKRKQRETEVSPLPDPVRERNKTVSP